MQGYYKMIAETMVLHFGTFYETHHKIGLRSKSVSSRFQEILVRHHNPWRRARCKADDVAHPTPLKCPTPKVR